MTDVPDTGLVEAFRPLKSGGAGSQERPTCANCPCGTKDMPGSGGNLLCNRYPPEMNMMVKQVMGAIQQIPQVGFKPVHPAMVCWEHPVLQARMRRAVEKAEAAMQPPSSGVQRRIPMLPATGAGYDPFSDDPRLTARPLVQEPSEPAAQQEADGRKPGDET